MVKGLRGLILLEAAAKRKMESCRKKIKQMGRGESPSSEDSSLEDLDDVKEVKQEVAEEFFCPECGEGGCPGLGVNCEKCGGQGAVVKQEVVEEGAGAAENVVVAADKGNGKGKGAELRQRNANFYKVIKFADGSKTFKCRRCFLVGGGTTSHSWDDFCTEPRPAGL